MSQKTVRTALLLAIVLVGGLLAWSYYKSRKAAKAAAAAAAGSQALAAATAPTAATSLGIAGAVDQFLGNVPGFNVGA